MTCFRIGPFLFRWLPDGDDRGVGLVRVEIDGQVVELEGVSRDEWDEFAREVGP